jgi:hypothetical protein
MRGRARKLHANFQETQNNYVQCTRRHYYGECGTVQAIVLQNSELNLNENEIQPKFVSEDKKKHKNLVLE